ncbi:hypothetical protein BXZ70DRAFT_62042 [Cristinia sonorae]|uniref:Uncharacterized protein n=1 Tax=Cristinia sonorae TaxID=1940300 RepID=A0A8K0UQQ6_9AGAR|nr:hypothetical protein BXZ70DRAFT_62042 [Cristinia sonorae]
MAPVMIGHLDTTMETSSTSVGQPYISPFDNKTVFLVALVGAILFVGVGVCILGVILFQKLHPEEEDVGATAASHLVGGTRGLSPRFALLLGKVRVALKLQTSLKEFDIESRVVFARPAAKSMMDEENEDLGTSIPEILVTPPSTPCLVFDDDTAISGEDSLSSLSASAGEWNSTEWLREKHPADDAQPLTRDDAIESIRDSDTFAVDLLFEEVESYLSNGPSVPLATILEESDESDLPLNPDTSESVPSIAELLEGLLAAYIETQLASQKDDFAPQLLEVPPLCHTQTERDVAAEESRYPRFVSTASTVRRSALKSPVKVHWKKFKRTVSNPNFVTGVALASKSNIASITEAAKGRTVLAKHARRDTPSVWPSEDESDKLKRFLTTHF